MGTPTTLGAGQPLSLGHSPVPLLSGAPGSMLLRFSHLHLLDAGHSLGLISPAGDAKKQSYLPQAPKASIHPCKAWLWLLLPHASSRCLPPGMPTSLAHSLAVLRWGVAGATAGAATTAQLYQAGTARPCQRGGSV